MQVPRMSRQIVRRIGVFGAACVLLSAFTGNAAEKTFYEFGGQDDIPSMGPGLEQAYLNYRMTEGGHWSVATPKGKKKEAWSMWRVQAESPSQHISELNVKSTVQAKQGKFAGKLAVLSYAPSASGPWKSVYAHEFKANTDSWTKDTSRGEIKLEEPMRTVYLRMRLKPHGRSLLWWDFRVEGKTVKGKPVISGLTSKRFAVDAGPGLLYWIKDNKRVPIGQWSFLSGRSGWDPKVAVLGDPIDISGGDAKTIVSRRAQGKAGKNAKFKISYERSEDGINATWKLDDHQVNNVPGKRRFMFYYNQDSDLGSPEEVNYSSDEGVVEFVYPEMKLVFDFPGDVVDLLDWNIREDEVCQMNLTKAGWNKMTGDGLTVGMRVVSE